MRAKLKDLQARFVGAGGDGVFLADGSPAPKRTGVGLLFKCPCGKPHDEYDLVCVMFANPLDGGPSLQEGTRPKWQRTGDTIDTITLTPSILRTNPDGCK